MPVQTPIQAVPVLALNDLALPLTNWSYNSTLITAGTYTVFVWFYCVPNTIPQNTGNTLIYGPFVATITAPGVGNPIIPAAYLAPQSTFLARTQAFPVANLLVPPTDGSYRITSDLFLQTGG